jgi:hypothetical protein
VYFTAAASSPVLAVSPAFTYEMICSSLFRKPGFHASILWTAPGYSTLPLSICIQLLELDAVARTSRVCTVKDRFDCAGLHFRTRTCIKYAVQCALRTSYGKKKAGERINRVQERAQKYTEANTTLARQYLGNRALVSLLSATGLVGGRLL